MAYRKKKVPKSPGEIVGVLFAPTQKRERYRMTKAQQDVVREAFSDNNFYIRKWIGNVNINLKARLL